MSIKFDCQACGRCTNAPDNMAGQKARCPGCHSVLTVPFAAGFEVVDDDDSVDVVNDGPPAADGENRRPCPVCGERILTSARQRRYCKETFDPSLRRGPPSGGRSRSGGTSVGRLMIRLSVLYFFLAVLYFGVGALMLPLANNPQIPAPPGFFRVVGVAIAFFGVV